MKILYLFLIFYTLSLSRISKAALSFEDHAFPEFITSSRALAMGNAYICKVDDSWSAFYNPAGLGTVRDGNFQLINAHAEASNGMLEAIGKGPAIDVPGKYIETRDQDEMRQSLIGHEDKLAHSRYNLFPNITVRGMTLGYMYSHRDRAILNSTTATTNPGYFEVAERTDSGPVFALNASLFGGVIKVGASAVYLNRVELNESYAPASFPVTVNNSDYKSGKSLQVTAGARLTLPIALLPTFAAVLHNATDNDFEDASKGGLPTAIKQTFDVGFSLTPQIGKTVRLHLEANLKDVNDAYETDIKRRAAAGMELDFNRRLFLRAGLGDGWGSGGLGVRSGAFTLDLTTYAVDRSLDGFREEEDRRYVFSFSTGF
ncbi:MAG: hypothetical protein AB7I27_05400 [Bacteriovoracaceae bacterium]